MRRTWLVAVFLALGVAVLPARASADVIDFDPARPEDFADRLSPAELQRWEALRAGTRGATTFGVTPDGTRALVSIPDGNRNVVQVLDTTTGALRPYDMQTMSFFGRPIWTADREGIAVVAAPQVQGQPTQYALATVNLDAEGLAVGAAVTMPTGRYQFSTALYLDADGKLNFPALDLNTVDAIETFSPPTFDNRTPAERAALGQPDVVVGLAQGGVPKLVIVTLPEGTVTTVAELDPATDVFGALNSFAARPGARQVSWLTATGMPWAGRNINGRANRGGGMPTGYWNVQENLGHIPPADNRWLTERRLNLLDLEGGEPTVIENVDHPELLFGDTFWTADGSTLVVAGSLPSVLAGRTHPLYEYSAGSAVLRFAPDGTKLGLWTQPGLDDAGTSFLALDGQRLLVNSPTNTTRHLFTIDLATPSAAPQAVYTGHTYPSGVVYNGGTLVGTFLDVTDPGELRFGVTGDDGSAIAALTTVTDLNAGLRDAAGLAYEVIAYTTSAGVPVEGVYVYPKAWSLSPPTARPVVVWQAGGPGGQMTNTWGTSVESPYSLLPAFGIPVFVVNGSGRNSNGAAFYSAMADGRNYGQRDIRDVKEGVDALIAKGYVNPAAVGVTGCSYGGYFSLQSIVEFPTFYAASNAQCSLNDMMYEYNFGWSPFLAYLIGNSPTGDPAEFVRDSPTYNVGKMRTPLLLFHGTNDFLFFESITNVHDQLALQGVPTRFLRAIGYGHGIGGIQGVPNAGPRGQRAAFQLQLEWFRTHLPGAASPSLFASLAERLRPIVAPAPGLPRLGEER